MAARERRKGRRALGPRAAYRNKPLISHSRVRHRAPFRASLAGCGYDEAKAKWHEDCRILWNLTEEITGTHAMTKEGIKIKRRIARYRNDLIDLDEEGDIKKSIKRDIRMQRKLASA